jgi:hypothetical protein
LGSRATVAPGRTLTVKPLFLLAAGDISSASSSSATVAAPVDGLVPLVQIQGPSQLSACATRLQVDASRTTNLGGRPATRIVWGLQYANNQPSHTEQAIAAALTSFSGLSVDIDASLLSFNTEYIITVHITNFLGETGVGYHEVTFCSLIFVNE